MLGHEFMDMPGKSVAVGDKELRDHHPHETVMLLRCKWCNRTPSRVRNEKECPIHELKAAGKIVLSDFNPDGAEYFHGRKCVSCSGEIMQHWLAVSSGETYWCDEACTKACEGISDCVYNVEGISLPPA